MTLEPAEEGETTEEARLKLEKYLENGGSIEVDGQDLKMVHGTLKTAAVKSGVPEEKEAGGVSATTTIVLAVVFSLIGLAIIIAVIVIVMR